MSVLSPQVPGDGPDRPGRPEDAPPRGGPPRPRRLSLLVEDAVDLAWILPRRDCWHMVVPHRVFSHGSAGDQYAAGESYPENTNAELFQPRDDIAGSLLPDAAGDRVGQWGR